MQLFCIASYIYSPVVTFLVTSCQDQSNMTTISFTKGRKGMHNWTTEVVTKSGQLDEKEDERKGFFPGFWLPALCGSVRQPRDQLGFHLGAATTTQPPPLHPSPTHSYQPRRTSPRCTSPLTSPRTRPRRTSPSQSNPFIPTTLHTVQQGGSLGV